MYYSLLIQLKIFRNSKIINLIKGPILENPNLNKVPKVLVLQHCRGMENVDFDLSSDSECETDGDSNDHSHRMVSNLFCEFGRLRWLVMAPEKISQVFLE